MIPCVVPPSARPVAVLFLNAADIPSAACAGDGFEVREAASLNTLFAFTDSNNLWIRGNSGGNAVYGNWYEIWSGLNDGAGSGLDADKLDAHQGLWYQSGYNFGASQGGINKPMGDMFLPEVLGQDKMVFENFYLNDSGLTVSYTHLTLPTKRIV